MSRHEALEGDLAVLEIALKDLPADHDVAKAGQALGKALRGKIRKLKQERALEIVKDLLREYSKGG